MKDELLPKVAVFVGSMGAIHISRPLALYALWKHSSQFGVFADRKGNFSILQAQEWMETMVGISACRSIVSWIKRGQGDFSSLERQLPVMGHQVGHYLNRLNLTEEQMREPPEPGLLDLSTCLKVLDVAQDFLHPQEMWRKYRRRLYVDYLGGRLIKTDFGEDSLITWLYDRDNGRAAAEYAIMDILTEPA